MEKTNIEHFNSYLKQFIENIIETFDEYKDIIREYYKELLEEDKCSDDKYVKRFLTKTKDYKKHIAEENIDMFKEDIYILKNINFKTIWASGELSDTNKKKIWEYIQTLYVLSETIINDTKTISELVKQFKNIKDAGNCDDDSVHNIDSDVFNMLKNLSSNDNNLETIFKDGGMIGKLADELTKELDIDNMDLGVELSGNQNMDDLFSNLINGENSLKFMNLIQTVGNKIQTKIQKGEIDASHLLNEAQNVMSNFNNTTEASPPLNPTQERLRKRLDKRNENKKGE
tara:strand:+ start:143 stop:1000 length:858 start_codon:yes stop_codon:yes gene_type:complete